MLCSFKRNVCAMPVRAIGEVCRTKFAFEWNYCARKVTRMVRSALQRRPVWSAVATKVTSPREVLRTRAKGYAAARYPRGMAPNNRFV
jgi:hypothetical protein